MNLASPSGTYRKGHVGGLIEPCYRIIKAYNIYNNAIKFNSDSYTKIIDGETCTRYIDANYKNIRINMIKEYNKKINGEDFIVKVLEFRNTKEANIKPGIIKMYCTKNNEILMLEYENSILLGVKSINNPQEYEKCQDEERIIPGFREVNPKNIYK